MAELPLPDGLPLEPSASAAVDAGTERRLGAAVGFVGYAFVAAFLTLAALLAFGANRDPTPTELAFAIATLWLPAVAGAAIASAPGGDDARRRRTGIAVAAIGVAGFVAAALAGRALFPGYPVAAPAETIAIRHVLVGGVPGLVAVALAALRESRSPLAHAAAPLAWAVALAAIAMVCVRTLDHPLRDALPASAAFQRLEFFNRTGSSRDILRADLGRDEALAYFGRLGLEDRPGAMPAWEYPTASWFAPSRAEGPRWLRIDELGPHQEIHCSTFATWAAGTAYVQRRCDPR